MSRCQEIQSQLSLFADGLLPPDEHVAVLNHVRECANCAGVLADLERVVAAARELGPIAPPEHIWLEVAGQMRLADHLTPARPSARPAVRPRWQWVGLAAALVGVTVALYLFRGSVRAPASLPASTSAAPTGSVAAVTTELNLALQHYERAVAELEAVAQNGDSSLDPSVARTLQQNLGTIDQAIAESRAALETNPDSVPARDSLFEALRRKISVLQATVALVNEMRQGDPEGAARAAEGLGKKS